MTILGGMSILFVELYIETFPPKMGILSFFDVSRSLGEDFGRDSGALGGILAPCRPLGQGLECLRRQRNAKKAS